MNRLLLLSFLFLLAFHGYSQKKDTVTTIGVGDIMMGSNYPNGGILPPDNGIKLMAEVAPILSDADITMGNLEGVLLDEGGTPKTCHDPKVCYAFRSPVSFVQNLTNAGFDVLSLANNHTGDFGDVGRQSSMKTLESVGLEHAGSLPKKYTTFVKDNIRYGFAAFAPNSGCVNLNDLNTAKSIVKYLESISDIVIVSFHGGAEGASYQHVPRKSELFYGENRGNVYDFAHQLIDAGADIIFGHGPHVTRAIEIYKQRFIAYSLGNFCTYGGINVSGVNGLAPIIKVFTNSKGLFYKAKITSTYQNYRSNVMIDSEKRVLKRIQELTKQDFPENTYSIDDNGWIKPPTSVH
jgi:Bacterial capsule synthesis protein PGA_cap